MPDPATRVDPAADAFRDAGIVFIESICNWERMSKERRIAWYIDAALSLSRSDDDRRRYLFQFLLPMVAKPSRGAPRKTARDQAIVDVIVYIQRCYGIDPTRNRATRDRLSGCAIVSLVLCGLGINLGEEGVAEVWRQMGHRAQPDKWIPFLLRQAGVRE
jgi:hypothetical protein